jgi:4'-phosphopantetheinyl transferase
MPIIKKIETEVGILGIWKLSESVNELVSLFNFSTKEKEEFSKIKADRRKTEYLAARLLLNELVNEKKEIQYQKSGKPELKNSQKNISISHSADFVVVFLSDKEIGIDVEYTQRNIKKVASRFLHEEEFKHIQSLDDPQTATVLFWSAKEAFFKCTD